MAEPRTSSDVPQQATRALRRLLHRGQRSRGRHRRRRALVRRSGPVMRPRRSGGDDAAVHVLAAPGRPVVRHGVAQVVDERRRRRASWPGDTMTCRPPCWRSRFQPRSSITSPTASMSTRTGESGSAPNSNTDMSGSEVTRSPSIERDALEERRRRVEHPGGEAQVAVRAEVAHRRPGAGDRRPGPCARGRRRGVEPAGPGVVHEDLVLVAARGPGTSPSRRP